MKAQQRLAALILATVVLSAPAGAEAATFGPATAKPCFGFRDVVPLFGTGFTPGGPVQIARDGDAIGIATADPSGNVGGVASVPRISGSNLRSTYTATDQTNPSLVGTSQPVLFSALKVNIRPVRGDARRARISTRGWTVRGRSVFAHVRRGRYKRNFSVGRLKGPCRTSSKLVRVFGRSAPFGTYRVQFDTFRRYKRSRRQRVPFRITLFRRFRTAGAASASLFERWRLVDPRGEVFRS